MRAALPLALLLGACSPAAAPGQGAPSGPNPSGPTPSGIVSLNPCTDAILAEVADPARIAALSAYSSDPSSSSMDVAAARRFPAITGTVEEIAALRPALVIGGTFTPPATRAALARLGIPLVELPIAQTVTQSETQVRQIAALAGNPARGEALVARIEQALRKAAPPHGAPVTAIVWQSGGIVPGPDSLIADLLTRTGFTSLSAARGLKQADYLPLERMLVDPPRVILAASDSPSGENRLLTHPVLARLTHTARARLDPSLLWCGGSTIIRAAERLSAVRRKLAR
ncbi:ABC transporter substrate-binding protein [Novosphingobium flavum]|uniref:ABC transporter substrate-binding protein n=1 Tax=Novosphingobium flavum TaxID=1778672 RepID=A0A7X1KK58_9SPHN|nr:ABC transporter substrate-binding protein [Novosphingobium flavum]MBC2663943.1 ABC transporter substrate-binding protein [Novosphingobium flavum]